MSHGRPDHQSPAEVSLEPIEGWHCCHLYYTFDRGVLDRLPPERIQVGREALAATLDPQATSAPVRLQTSVVSGHKADFALIKCEVADRMGNLTYNKTARNFSPLMCMAAETPIVQARRIVEPGEIDPEHVITPAIFVDHIVEVPEPLIESQLIAAGRTYP